MRTLLFWIHLVAGVVAGSIVLVMSATGVLLTYEKQIVAWSERDYRAAPPSADAPRVSLEEVVVARVRQARQTRPSPDSPCGPTPRRRSRSCLRRNRMVFVNPYTGAVLGEGNRARPRVFPERHRLAPLAGDERRSPDDRQGDHRRRQSRVPRPGRHGLLPVDSARVVAPALRAVTWFRGGLRGTARDFNWHNAIGLWSVVPLFLIVISGAVISYPWATALVYRVTGNDPPAPQQRRATPPRGQRAGRRRIFGTRSAGHACGGAVARVGVDRAARARRSRRRVTFTLDRGTGTRPDTRATLVLDRPAGRSSAGSRMPRRTAARKRAPGCAGSTPAKPAVSSARPSRASLRPGPCFSSIPASRWRAVASLAGRRTPPLAPPRRESPRRTCEPELNRDP